MHDSYITPALALQGEMSATVMRYPQEYLAMATRVRERIIRGAGPRSRPENVSGHMQERGLPNALHCMHVPSGCVARQISYNRFHAVVCRGNCL